MKHKEPSTRLSPVLLRRSVSALGKAWMLEGEGEALVLFHQFATFSEAWDFLSEVAGIIEAGGHHLDWSNSRDRVLLRLSTPGGGGVSAADLGLARQIDAVLRRRADPGLPVISCLVAAGTA